MENIPEKLTKNIVAQGIMDNMPEIISALKEVFVVHKKEKIFNSVLKNKLNELQINQQNFAVLVNGLTELSKSNNVNEDTKNMYREMIKTLFDYFTNKMNSDTDFNNFLNDL